MENLRADIALRIVEERGRLGYSQADFAGKTGISREGLRLYETGQRGVPVEFLAAAVSLGMDAQYVLIGVRSKNLEEVVKKASPELAANISNSSNVIGIVNKGAKVNQIHTERVIQRTVADVKPGDEHISDKEAAVLTGLVNDVVELEAKLKKKPKGHRAVWGSLNAHCNVPKYRLIKSEDFGKAKLYLNKWLALLNAMPSASAKTPDTWRKRKYAYIKVNTKEPARAQALEEYIKRYFCAESIAELSDEELGRTYQYVAGLKRRKTL